MAIGANGMWSVELTTKFQQFMFDESPVAALVAQEMRRGKRCAEAIDFVCGVGSYKKFAEEIWTACRSNNKETQK